MSPGLRSLAYLVLEGEPWSVVFIEWTPFGFLDLAVRVKVELATRANGLSHRAQLEPDITYWSVHSFAGPSGDDGLSLRSPR